MWGFGVHHPSVVPCLPSSVIQIVILLIKVV